MPRQLIAAALLSGTSLDVPAWSRLVDVVATLVVLKQRSPVARSKTLISEDYRLKIGDTEIDETYAEGFTMRYARVLVTAHDAYWLDHAVQAFSGYATSVIGCDAEVGVEQWLTPHESPDHRPGAALLVFGFSYDAIAAALVNRVGQCLLTCATAAAWDGLPEAENRVPMGKQVRFFGDGFQKSKRIDERRFWRIPVMEGEFLVEADVGAAKGVAGGNFIIQSAQLAMALQAARRAVATIDGLPGVIAPFPGGVARSGSKVGSRYQMVASTAEQFCPTLRGRVDSALHPDANVALEIVVNGTSRTSVEFALAEAIRAAAGPGVAAISAGNYGGKLGKHLFHLHSLLAP